MGNLAEFEFSGTERFEVKRRIGSGGMGVVYEARDLERDELVALKRIKHFDATGLLRFKEEFRVLHDLSHPNLVGLGELFEAEGDWFFTMELVQGVDFLAWVRHGESSLASASTADGSAAAGLPTPSDDTLRTERVLAQRVTANLTPGYDEARLRAALKGLAGGIGALHDAAKVHRDIKPTNILVTADGRAVLLDFGLVRKLTIERQSLDASAVGTAEYMAPEQAYSGRVGAPADWYSLGVILYEALTGRLPHSGRTSVALLMDKQQRTPTPPRAWVPEVPLDLDELCVQLLRQEPERRPGGPEIFERLGISGQAMPSRRASSSSTGLGMGMPFVGRERELEQLHAAFERSRIAPLAVIVEGESGLGKTQLADEFTSQLRDRVADVVVLSSRCYERESVAYKAFDGIADALSRYLARLPKLAAVALLPRRAGLLPRLFQVLHRVEAIAQAPPVADLPDPLEQRRRMFRALRELFARLVEQRPVVLCLDDLQWTDGDSLALLEELLADDTAPPLLVLATMRPCNNEHRRAILAKVSAATPTERLLLGELPVAQARELAALLMPDTNDTALDLVAQSTGGHPLFIHELARHLGTEIEHEATSLNEALTTRIGTLSQDALGLLQVVCVAASPISHEVAAAAAGLDGAAEARAAKSLRAGHLVRTDGIRGSDTIVAYHDRIRVLVADSLEPERRRRWHSKLAQALETAGAAESDPQSLLRHAVAAGDTEAAAQYAQSAARNAAGALAFEQAAAFYAEALGLGDYDAQEPERARALRIKMASALASAGCGFDSGAAFIEAAKGAERVTSLDCRRQAAEQWLVSGHTELGLEAIGGLLDEIGEPMPATPTRALLSALKNRFKLRLRGLRWKQRSPSEISQSAATQLDVLKAVSVGLSMVDNIRGADFSARYLRLALRTGDVRHVAMAYGVEAVFRGSQGGRGCAQARQLVEQLRRISREAPQDHSLSAWATGLDGVIGYFEGRLSVAEALLADSVQTFVNHTSGRTYERNNMRLFRMFCLRYLGRFRQLSQLLGEYVRDAIQRGDNYAATTLRRFGIGFTHLIDDQPQLARDVLQQASWAPPGEAFHLQHWYELEAKAEIALYERDVAGNADELREGFRRLSASLLLRVRNVRVASTWLQGRLLVGAAGEGEGNGNGNGNGKVDRRQLRKIISRLEREKFCLASVPALLLKAAAPCRDWAAEPEQRIAWLREALLQAEQAEMGFHAQAARVRLAQLLQSSEGAELMVEARAWMQEAQIKRPDRMLEIMAPGFPEALESVEL